MRTISSARVRRTATATLLGISVFAAGAALAGPIPPAHFTYDVYHGHRVLKDCTPFWGTTTSWLAHSGTPSMWNTTCIGSRITQHTPR